MQISVSAESANQRILWFKPIPIPQGAIHPQVRRLTLCVGAVQLSLPDELTIWIHYKTG
jgi:hypothetical protein